MKRLFLTIALVLLVGGCKTTVNLGVKNLEGFPMNVAVEIKEQTGIRTGSISMGELPPGGVEKTTFEVKKGGAFSVIGSNQRGCIIHRGPDITVTGESDPLNKELTITASCEKLDDTMAFEKLSRSFKNLGPDIGASPIGLKNALDTRIGSLVVAIPDDIELRKAGKILYVVTPEILDVYVMKLEDIQFQPTNEIEKVAISGSASGQAAVTYGPIAHFGINWSNSSVYELKWVLRGFGHFNKKEDSNKDPIMQFNRLPSAHRQQIRTIMRENPKANIYYINRAYVLERAELFVKEGNELSGGAEIDAATVLKGSAAYSFKNSTETSKGYGPVVLNYWGDEYHIVEVPAIGGEESSIPRESGAEIKTGLPPDPDRGKRPSKAIGHGSEMVETGLIMRFPKVQPDLAVLKPTGRSITFTVK